jgi:two-component system cell cycle sensor histidine kinase/response regulator CckA
LLVLRALKQGGYEVSFQRVQAGETMARALGEHKWDVILSDYSMPGFTAWDALGILRESGLDVPFIMLSGTVNEEVAVEAMRAGARDFISKDKLARLCPALERELREARLRAEARGLQEQLRHAQKMEAVGQLAGGVAHDFNNVLSAILTFSELRLREMAPADPAREDLEEIKKAGERAASLTRQLLAFSRQQVIELRPLNLNAVVENMDKMFRRVIGEDIVLKTRMDPGLGQIRADVGQLEQVLMNLVVNARDAMPSGGELIIETANVELDEAYAQAHLGVKPGPHAMLAVHDSGTGMDEATRSRIFEPFFTTKPVGRGTGLGLSTVFGIVHQLGGSIWVDSERGQGTTFKIYLARTEEAAEGSRSPKEGAAARGSETVLLVEDDEQVRRVARGILTRNGYKVLEARDAAEAVRFCEAKSSVIDLLLSDVVMPQVSGPELADRLISLRPAMKVLFMSGYTGEAVANRGVLRQGAAFIQKPLTPETLTRKVRDVLESRERPFVQP